ncbi:hypothetical protein [Nocardia sp. NRRL S-836]|uniref:hypothetical protein n=1 Tax=Nocardia sp. NRRL S-836 TaxID=1519492 RepID=UPI0006B015BC|nr:hypothetical protein [Nocardia sp. NRRL S-836]KOV83113.1 hypothetical protein ADL03_21305 [Nocardia sp. NRRL S-836]
MHQQTARPRTSTSRTPTALFVVWNSASRVAQHVRDATAAHAGSSAVTVTVATPQHTHEIPPLLRTPADMVVLDGHGYLPPRVGRLELTGHRIRDHHGQGITAPIIVIGACYGADPLFVDAVRDCLDRPAVLVGCDGETDLCQAGTIYPPLLDLLARQGANILAEHRADDLHALVDELGDTAAGWQARLLTPPTATHAASR